MRWRRWIATPSSDRRPARNVPEETALRESFTTFHEQHAGAVSRYCQVRIGNHHDAEDVAAQVFAQAWRAYPPDDRGNHRSWLFTIAHNCVINFYRQQSTRGPSAAFDERLAITVPDDADSPEELVLRRERAGVLAGALDTLPLSQREVVELRLAGLKGAEIATVTGRSESAVKMLQFRAMKRLREHLLADPGTNDDLAGSRKETADVPC